MSLHPELAAFAERELGDILAAPPLTTQDALEFALVNGVRVIVRYAAPDAYSLRWWVGDAELGIDTAPTHPAQAPPPHPQPPAHRTGVADPQTPTPARPATHHAAVLRALAADPCLAEGPAR
mgnify:CR=1 FL=1